MQISSENKQPLVRLRQYVVEQNQFTPISAFLSLCGLIIPFTQTPDTVIPFLLILSPIYINKKSYVLNSVIILIALFWPLNDQEAGTYWFLNIEENDIIMRVLLIIDAIYMTASFKKQGKYKMTPSAVENNQFPILI